jgi:hypothetical protein
MHSKKANGFDELLIAFKYYPDVIVDLHAAAEPKQIGVADFYNVINSVCFGSKFDDIFST